MPGRDDQIRAEDPWHCSEYNNAFIVDGQNPAHGKSVFIVLMKPSPRAGTFGTPLSAADLNYTKVSNWA